MASACSMVKDVKLNPVFYVNKKESLRKTAKIMELIKTETAVVLTSEGKPSRVLTSEAITRRVVYKGVQASRTFVLESTTANYPVVRSTKRLARCLEIMVEKRVTNLPVVDEAGKARGVLGIMECLEHVLASSLLKVCRKHARLQLLERTPFFFPVWRGLVFNMERLERALASSILKGLTLGDIISEQTPSVVDMKDSALSAAKAIIRGRGKPVLVIGRVGRVVGIVTQADLNSKIVGKGLDPNATVVSTFMAPRPDTVPPETTVLQALRKMMEEKLQYLPVLDVGTGTEGAGVLDVLDILRVLTGHQGGKRWKAFFDDATNRRMSGSARSVDNPDGVATRSPSSFPRR